MTNWMTAAGLALIAGGLAVLIGFRQVLLGGGGDRRERRRVGRRADFSVPAQIRARRRRQSLAAAPAVAAAVNDDVASSEHKDESPAATGADAEPAASAEKPSTEPAGSEHLYASPVVEGIPGPQGDDAALSTEPAGSEHLYVTPEAGSDEEEPVVRVFAGDAAEDDEPQTGTLASLGLAAAEEIEPALRPLRAREGDRVAGWVRPEYDEDPAPGEYWTPIPDASYGWPVPVERLPPVPAYPPQSGFDLEPVEEATSVVPQWPPAQPSERIELPRSWASRNVQARSGAEKEPRRRSAMRRRVPTPDTQTLPAVNDSETPPRNRPRPRPRPTPADRSNVYRSRHAADHD